VFNCAGTESGTATSSDDAADDVHRLRTQALSLTLAAEAARRNIPAYVELSTGHIYKPSRKPAAEDGKTKPWTRQAKWKLAVEEDLRKLCEDGELHAVVLRLGNVYGPYVTRFLGQALCLARVYQAEEREMRWLWGEDLRTDTVHVEDVVAAMWAVAEWYIKTSPKEMPVFNLVDQGETSRFRGRL
jgi:nucleoside-diphosphate-sugar epimerase